MNARNRQRSTGAGGRRRWTKRASTSVGNGHWLPDPSEVVQSGYRLPQELIDAVAVEAEREGTAIYAMAARLIREGLKQRQAGNGGWDRDENPQEAGRGL